MQTNIKATDSNPTFTYSHARNDQGQTLLSMIALQGPGLEEQKLLILRKEIQVIMIN